MNYILGRLKESSTWRGLVLVATSLGISVNPDLANYLIAAGTGVAGLIGIVFKDKLTA